MFKLEWQEYEDVQEWESKHYQDKDKAMESYFKKVNEGHYMVNLSMTLLENINEDAETYEEKTQNFIYNGGSEIVNRALYNSFGIESSHPEDQSTFEVYCKETVLNPDNISEALFTQYKKCIVTNNRGEWRTKDNNCPGTILYNQKLK